jgi:predicted tellurium resistance membrane protein TerC
MTVVAMTTGQDVLAVIGLVVGLLVLALAAFLLQTLLRPVREIERYSRDILDAGVAIATNLDGADELARTRSLAMAAPGLAVAYLKKLGLVR